MSFRRAILILMKATLSFSALCTVSAFTGMFRNSLSNNRNSNRIWIASSKRHPITKVFATTEENQSSAGSVILQGDNMSLLQSAFSALSDDDKYDAVMTGLCAKILDGEISAPDEDAVVKEASYQSPGYAILADPIKLLQEMNNRRLKASERSMMALIDVSLLFFSAALCSILNFVQKNKTCN